MSTTSWTGKEVRKTFVDYFCQKRGHTNVLSSSVIPWEDPTLLFTNSGMCQYKPIFLGQIDPKSDKAKWRRVANTQKCIRAGGKHNDLDDVGKDTYHHTFFEMLGNWSFGDYFQQEAIDWAWDILVNVFKLLPERIYVTYFGGDSKDGLPADTKAQELWMKYLPKERILPFGRKENFWEMGETGPCGPCSEIHYDRIGGRDAASMVNMDSPDVIEIWNLVFMQFNREESGKLTELPNKHVDTGMGFERLTSILQDVRSNYDTDIFIPIFNEIQKITGAPKYSGLLGKDDTDGRDTAYRIIADHIRTLTFAITDGARPGPEKRDFVLRRILRRAVRAGKEFLKANDGFFHNLVDVVVEQFGDAFPEIKENPQRVKQIIKSEEELFTRSLTKGINKFNSVTRKLKSGDTISGEDAFLLYGTYGFPLDLIKIMCEERGLNVDSGKFEEIFGISRQKSVDAYAAKSTTPKFALSSQATASLKEKGVETTKDNPKYEIEDISAKVKAIWEGNTENGSFKDSCSQGTSCVVILDTTNFYGNSGGQIGDTGFIANDDFTFTVDDTQVFGGYVVHIGTVSKGTIKVDAEVNCTVNNERRRPTMANHTSTHMLNWALRELVDSRVDQRGSVVSDERFRFDFTCGKPVGKEALEKVELKVNEMITKNLVVYIKEVDLEQAKKINGVRAMFTEAYPNPVRVVSLGASIDDISKNPSSNDWLSYSIEFCGGTHLKQTGEAQVFTIVSEEPISAGTRRIEAITGEHALSAIDLAARLEKSLEELSKLSDNDTTLVVTYNNFKNELDASRIPAYKKIGMRESLKAVEQRLKNIEKDSLSKKKQGSGSLLEKVIQSIKDSKCAYVVEVLDVGANNRLLSDTASEIVNNAKSQLQVDVAVMLISTDNNPKASKTFMVSNVPEALIKKGLKANEWVNDVAGALNGKGGGRKEGDVAQGNAPGIDKVDVVIKAAKDFAEKKLTSN